MFRSCGCPAVPTVYLPKGPGGIPAATGIPSQFLSLQQECPGCLTMATKRLASTQFPEDQR